MADLTRPSLPLEVVQNVEKDLNVAYVSLDKMAYQFLQSLDRSIQQHLLETVTNVDKSAVVKENILI